MSHGPISGIELCRMKDCLRVFLIMVAISSCQLNISMSQGGNYITQLQRGAMCTSQMPQNIANKTGGDVDVAHPEDVRRASYPEDTILCNHVEEEILDGQDDTEIKEADNHLGDQFDNNWTYYECLQYQVEILAIFEQHCFRESYQQASDGQDATMTLTTHKNVAASISNFGGGKPELGKCGQQHTCPLYTNLNVAPIVLKTAGRNTERDICCWKNEAQWCKLQDKCLPTIAREALSTNDHYHGSHCISTGHGTGLPFHQKNDPPLKYRLLVPPFNSTQSPEELAIINDSCQPYIEGNCQPSMMGIGCGTYHEKHVGYRNNGQHNWFMKVAQSIMNHGWDKGYCTNPTLPDSSTHHYASAHVCYSQIRSNLAYVFDDKHEPARGEAFPPTHATGDESSSCATTFACHRALLWVVWTHATEDAPQGDILVEAWDNLMAVCDDQPCILTSDTQHRTTSDQSPLEVDMLTPPLVSHLARISEKCPGMAICTTSIQLAPLLQEPICSSVAIHSLHLPPQATLTLPRQLDMHTVTRAPTLTTEYSSTVDEALAPLPCPMLSHKWRYVAGCPPLAKLAKDYHHVDTDHSCTAFRPTAMSAWCRTHIMTHHLGIFGRQGSPLLFIFCGSHQLPPRHGPGDHYIGYVEYCQLLAVPLDIWFNCINLIGTAGNPPVLPGDGLCQWLLDYHWACTPPINMVTGHGLALLAPTHMDFGQFVIWPLAIRHHRPGHRHNLFYTITLINTVGRQQQQQNLVSRFPSRRQHIVRTSATYTYDHKKSDPCLEYLYALVSANSSTSVLTLIIHDRHRVFTGLDTIVLLLWEIPWPWDLLRHTAIAHWLTKTVFGALSCDKTVGASSRDRSGFSLLDRAAGATYRWTSLKSTLVYTVGLPCGLSTPKTAACIQIRCHDCNLTVKERTTVCESLIHCRQNDLASPKYDLIPHWAQIILR